MRRVWRPFHTKQLFLPLSNEMSTRSRTQQCHGFLLHRTMVWLTCLNWDCSIDCSGLHVEKVAEENGLIAVGDYCIAVDGVRMTATSLAEILRQPAPLRVVTILRRCPEHDLSAYDVVYSAHEVSKAVPILAAACRSQDAQETTDRTSSNAVGKDPSIDAVKAEPESRRPQLGPARRLMKKESFDPPTSHAPAKHSADYQAAFEPFHQASGEWCDLPGVGRHPLGSGESCLHPEHYDDQMGGWSDVPLAAATQSRIDALASTRAVLDMMVRQALASQDHELLRRLVAEQQRHPKDPARSEPYTDTSA